jgi:hypothetical protein
MTSPLTPHLDADRIAAVEADAVDPAVAAEARAHLETCPECRAVLDRVVAVREQLGALPPERMPAGVWRRMEGALGSAATQSTVLPMNGRGLAGSRWRRPGVAALAAAAAVVALVAAVVVGANRSDNSARPAAGPDGVTGVGPGFATPQSTPTAFATLTSGHTYTADPRHNQQLLRELLQHSTSVPGNTSGVKPQVAPPLQAFLASPQPALTCDERLTAGGDRVQAPIVVDLAQFTDPAHHLRNAPVLVIVVPTDNPNVDWAYIVGPKCATAPDNDLKQLVTVPVPH